MRLARDWNNASQNYSSSENTCFYKDFEGASKSLVAECSFREKHMHFILLEWVFSLEFICILYCAECSYLLGACLIEAPFLQELVATFIVWLSSLRLVLEGLSTLAKSRFVRNFFTTLSPSVHKELLLETVHMHISHTGVLVSLPGFWFPLLSLKWQAFFLHATHTL